MNSTQIKVFYQKHLSFDGQTKITHGIFYRVTDGNMLFKLQTERSRGGYIDVSYEIVPLIVPLTACPEKYSVTALTAYYADIEYRKKQFQDAFCSEAIPYTSLKDTAQPDNNFDCLYGNLLQYANSEFLKIHDFEDYCRFCMAGYDALEEERRMKAAQNYPKGYPLQGDYFCGNGGYIWLCTYFEKYEEALRRINGERAHLLTITQNSFAHGYTTQETLEASTEKIAAMYAPLEAALLQNDQQACNELILSNYRANCVLLHERFGFEARPFRGVFVK